MRVFESIRFRPLRIANVAIVFACLGCENEPTKSVEGNGWSVNSNSIKCSHPHVEKSCENGWCKVPSGCFLMGSPPNEPGRGAFNEELTAVTFTRSFYIQQTEMTQAQWLRIAEKNPSDLLDYEFGANCMSPDCPVANISWQAAAAFANRLSESEGRQPCYELVGCSGELGTLEFECENVRLSTETTHECVGYRLPTAAEWEYAARAGTRTAFYSGDLEQAVGCNDLCPATNEIAWSCHNSKAESHPVGQKRPNGWGLYDMLGNVVEHTSWLEAEPDPVGPLVDPQSTLGRHDEKFDSWIAKGGFVNFDHRLLRSASEYSVPWKEAGVLVGFRLVRTLPVE